MPFHKTTNTLCTLFVRKWPSNKQHSSFPIWTPTHRSSLLCVETTHYRHIVSLQRPLRFFSSSVHQECAATGNSLPIEHCSSYGLGDFTPSTPLADTIIAAGTKKLLEGEKSPLAQFRSAKEELVAELEKSYQNVMLGPQNIADPMAKITDNLQNMDESLKAFDQFRNIELPADLDSALEVHGVTELTSRYLAAINVIPSDMPHLELQPRMAHQVEHMNKELDYFNSGIKKTEKTLFKQAAHVSLTIQNLLRLRVDDLLQLYPEIDAQLEKEIQESRWDLLVQNQDE